MPEAVHNRLKAAARRKGYKGDRAKRYIYGTLTNIEKKKKKEARMNRKRAKALGSM
jgi:ribosomal protein S21